MCQQHHKRRSNLNSNPSKVVMVSFSGYLHAKRNLSKRAWHTHTHRRKKHTSDDLISSAGEFWTLCVVASTSNSGKVSGPFVIIVWPTCCTFIQKHVNPKKTVSLWFSLGETTSNTTTRSSTITYMNNIAKMISDHIQRQLLFIRRCSRHGIQGHIH